MMRVCRIPVNECIHYRGFRYGGYNNNIYEDYVIGLANGDPIKELRRIFVSRVLSLQGSDFGSTLNIKLNRRYPSWLYPWQLRSIGPINSLTEYAPDKNPDIICHYSSQGVLASHINREFLWLEQAFKAMKAGYDPKSYGYIDVCLLRKPNQVRYLVLDGNHRISALHALGITSVLTSVKKPILCDLSRQAFWPGVIFGYFLQDDAVKIFNRYFFEYNLPLPEQSNSKVIYDEAPLW